MVLFSIFCLVEKRCFDFLLCNCNLLSEYMFGNTVLKGVIR